MIKKHNRWINYQKGWQDALFKTKKIYKVVHSHLSKVNGLPKV